jgi:ATP-dependent DNA helicase RecG
MHVQRVRKELEAGGRVFVVFPVIDESEEIPELRAAETEFKNLEEEFKEFKFGLVHGRMRTQEKEEAMERFKSGETQVLVSTTVIEVGIDIPEASMIVIEHAERYGMAQLHQLRGRVGRGTRASSCILLGSRPSSLTRLKLLETSRDGFYLAEIDLQQRGPGDMLGKRQSGFLPEFNIARLETDGDVLEQARQAAEVQFVPYDSCLAHHFMHLAAISFNFFWKIIMGFQLASTGFVATSSQA